MNMDGFRIFEVQERNPLNIQIYFERNENYEKASSIFSFDPVPDRGIIPRGGAGGG